MRVTRELQLRLRGPLRPAIRYVQFFMLNTHYIDGDPRRLHVGTRVGLANTICNVASGSIFIGDNCAFGYNVMLLTGRHMFRDGLRASLWGGDSPSPTWGGGHEEVPDAGYDIRIGSGCWIASGVVVSGGVTIGRNCIVAANAVVTRNIPDFAIAAGIPARVVGDTRSPGPRCDEPRPES